MEESSWSPQSWIYRGKRPPNDDVYFENITHVIFQAGLSWKMISEKWSNFRKAFENFSIDKVAEFGDSALVRLMANKGIVRNRRKIEATISNAKEFQKIKREWESFQSYFDGLEKSQNYALVIKEFGSRFQRLGPSSVRMFLYSVGENMKHP